MGCHPSHSASGHMCTAVLLRRRVHLAEIKALTLAVSLVTTVGVLLQFRIAVAARDIRLKGMDCTSRALRGRAA